MSKFKVGDYVKPIKGGLVDGDYSGVYKVVRVLTDIIMIQINELDAEWVDACLFEKVESFTAKSFKFEVGNAEFSNDATLNKVKSILRFPDDSQAKDNELKRQALIKKENALSEKYQGDMIANALMCDINDMPQSSVIVAAWLIYLNIPPARLHAI